MLIKAFDKKQEKRLWDIWSLKYPHMTHEDFISFEDFKKESLTPKSTITEKSLEEIEEEMNKVITRYEGR